MSTLEDREAIRDVLHRYCYGTDGGDTELWVEGFTDDCVWDGGPMGYLEGKEAMREFHKPNVENAKGMRHLTLNTVFDIQGDTARVISYVMVMLRGESPSVFFLGHYDDQFVKVDGKWRIKVRKLREDLSDVEAPRVQP